MTETSFPNAKSHHARLIAYKAFADVAGKGALFVITVVAARRLSAGSFGIFSLGSTLGWLVAVGSDCGIQLHLARAVARRRADAAWLLRGWLRVRLWTAAGAVALVAVGIAAGAPTPIGTPILILAVVYACSGLIELLHYFYRGLSRSDVESSLTLWQRGGTLACGLIALAWKPDLTILAIAMLIPVVFTLAASLRLAARLAPATVDSSADLQVGDDPDRTGRPEGLHYDNPRTNGAPDRLTVSSADLQVCRDPDSTSRPEGLHYDNPATAGRPDGLRNDNAQRIAACSWPVFRRDVSPIGVGIVLSALYFRIDLFLVQLWSGTEAVAFYNAVFRLVEALRLFPAAVLAVVLPSMVRAGDLRPLTRVAVPMSGFALLVSAVLWIAAGWLIPFLYGAPYARAVPAFRVLLLAFPLLSLNLALTHQLVGWDGQRVYAGLCALALATNVALNARLIPAWSFEGAAWATLGTELVLTVGCVAALWSLRAPAQAGTLVTER